MRRAKVQTSLRIHAVSPEPVLFAHEPPGETSAKALAKGPGMRTERLIRRVKSEEPFSRHQARVISEKFNPFVRLLELLFKYIESLLHAYRIKQFEQRLDSISGTEVCINWPLRILLSRFSVHCRQPLLSILSTQSDILPRPCCIQSNLNSSSPDSSFTMANSNSFLSPYEMLLIAQEKKNI